MSQENATSEQSRPRKWRRWLLGGLAVLVAGVCAAFLFATGTGAEAGGDGTARATADRPSPARSLGAMVSPGPASPDLLAWPADLIWPSDRSFKADHIGRLGYAPEVVFFGGSRARRFQPSYLEDKTGLRGFNLAMTNAKPEDAWVFAHFLHERAPETTIRWVWSIHVSTLMVRDLSPGLIQDRRLSRYLPTSLLLRQAALLPTSPDKVPDKGRTSSTKYAPDGAVISDSYDRAEARGRTLEESLQADIPRYIDRIRVMPLTLGTKPSRNLAYFEATVAYLDEIGAEVVLVAMPMHPKVLAAVRAKGWQGRHDGLLAYVASLSARHDLKFIDLTEIESFGGDPNDFYDAVHIKRANSRRVIDKLVREFPEVFAK